MHTEEGLAGIKHDYTVLGFVCCSSDCKNHHCIITPRAHARSGVKQSVLSVSQSVSQSSVVCLSGEKN